MNNKKKKVFIVNGILLCWFLLDLVGMKIGKQVLVTQAYKEDGIFFIIFVMTLLWFWKNEKMGKYVLEAWLFMWLITQFFSHWYFTIWGPWEGKNQYFEGTLKLIRSDLVYIPDLYPIVLHGWIVITLILTLRYNFDPKKKK